MKHINESDCSKMKTIFLGVCLLSSLVSASSARRKCQLLSASLIEKIPETWSPQKPDIVKPKEFLEAKRSAHVNEALDQAGLESSVAQKLASMKADIVSEGGVEGEHFRISKDQKGSEVAIVFLPPKEGAKIEERWAALYRFVNYATKRLKTGVVYSPLVMNVIAPDSAAAFSPRIGPDVILVSDSLISQGPWSPEHHELMHAFMWQLRKAKRDSVFHGAVLNGEVYADLGLYKSSELDEWVAFPHGQRFDVERINPRVVLPKADLVAILTTMINQVFFLQFLTYDGAVHSDLAAKSLNSLANLESLVPQGKALSKSSLNTLQISKDKSGSVKVDVYFDSQPTNLLARKGLSVEFLNIEELFDAANNPALSTATRIEALQKIIALASQRAQNLKVVATAANYFATQIMGYMKEIKRENMDQADVYKDLRGMLVDVLQVTTKNIVFP